VLTERMQARIDSLPASDARAGAALLRRLATQRDQARARLLEVLNSDRYVALLDSLAEAAADPPLFTADDLVGAARPGPSDRSNGHGPVNGTSAEEWTGPASTALSLVAPSLMAASSSSPSAGVQAPDQPFPVSFEAATGPADESDAGPSPGDQPAREVLPRLVRRPWRHLRQAVEALGDHPPDEALHEVRIRSKRLRYAAEAATPVIGKPAQRFASAVAALQGVLGDMNDAVVAEAWLRQSASAGSASQALVAGELIALERQAQQVGRDSWAAPWKAAAKPDLRAWLKG